MVTLPVEFVKTKYPGYFWNVTTKKLYSIKVTGELKPLKFQKGGTFGWKVIAPGYAVSVGGVRRRMTLDYLHTLYWIDQKQEIGVAE